MFNEQASKFHSQGFYCPAPVRSKDFIQYWDDEKNKCRKGAIFKEGDKVWYLTRDYYMFLNFLRINDKEKKKFDFPGIRDAQYHMALYECLAELNYKHASILKKRQIASSYSLATGSMKLTLQTDSEGSFRKLLPSMSYTMSSSTMRWENGLSIPYSGSTKVTIAGDNVFTQMTLTRGTTRSVSASWNKSLMQSALPGVEVTYVVKVTNTGNIADTYIASYSESKTDVVVTQHPNGVWIDFGEDNVGSVEVTVNASAKARAGETKVPIQIRSKSSGSTRADVDLYLLCSVIMIFVIRVRDSTRCPNLESSNFE